MTIIEKEIDHGLVVGIHRENGEIIVRKSLLIYGIRVPVYETIALSEEDAIKTQNYLIHEHFNFRLN